MNGFPGELSTFLNGRGVSSAFINNDAGLLCYEATLPGSSLATADVYGDFMGVTQKYAHSRMYDQLTLGFYCDLNYSMLKLFEHWIEFIASGSNQSKSTPGYFVRMRYPDTYKCKSGFSITKFEKDKKIRPLEYNFFNVFPVSLSSTPVSYDGAQVLRVNVTLSYDTYQCGKTSSVAIARNTDSNKEPTTTQVAPVTPPVAPAPFNTDKLTRNLSNEYYNNGIIRNTPGSTIQFRQGPGDRKQDATNFGRDFA